MENNNQNLAVSPVEEMANLSQMLEASSKLSNATASFTLSTSYIELSSEGDSFRGIYAGITTISMTDQVTGEPKDQEVARFLIDKQVRINGGAVLLSELKSTGVAPGTALEVTFVEKKGKTKIYSLTLLSV
jgi:hypothetical protein